METREFLRSLGAVLSQKRRSRKLTQEALAERIGATAQWVSEIERGGTPSVEMMLKLADALETTLPALMEAACSAESLPAHVRDLLREVQDLPPDATRVLLATARALRAEHERRRSGG